MRRLTTGRWLAGAAVIVCGGFTSSGFSAENHDIRLTLERPSAGDYTSGIGLVQGWAVAPAGIDRIELYIDEEPDGSPNQKTAYGGSRRLVCDSFADASRYPDCSPPQPGFASTVNFNGLGDGTHRFTVRAYDNNGDHRDATVSIRTNSLGEEFIGDASRIALPGFEVTGLRRSTEDGVESYDLEFEWSTAAQQYVMTDVNPAPAQPLMLVEAPSGVSATTSDSGRVTLTWTDTTPNGGSGDEDWFIVERKYENVALNRFGEYAVVGVVSRGVTAFVDDGVTLEAPLPGSYSYRVKAASPGTTEASAEATVAQTANGETLTGNE